eukprot:3826442-Prymnesium_polylepis.2
MTRTRATSPSRPTTSRTSWTTPSATLPTNLPIAHQTHLALAHMPPRGRACEVSQSALPNPSCPRASPPVVTISVVFPLYCGKTRLHGACRSYVASAVANAGTCTKSGRCAHFTRLEVAAKLRRAAAP